MLSWIYVRKGRCCKSVGCLLLIAYYILPDHLEKLQVLGYKVCIFLYTVDRQKCAIIVVVEVGMHRFLGGFA